MTNPSNSFKESGWRPAKALPRPQGLAVHREEVRAAVRASSRASMIGHHLMGSARGGTRKMMGIVSRMLRRP